MKNTFIIYADYEDKIDMLADDQKGKLFKALFAHNRGEDLSNTLDAAGKMAFSFIKDQMKRDGDAYEEIKRARSEAGKKGMESRWKNAESAKISSVSNSALSDITLEADLTNDNKIITNNNKHNNVKFVKNADNKNNLNVDVYVNDNVYVDDDKERKKKGNKALSSPTFMDTSNFKILLDEPLRVDIHDSEFNHAIIKSQWLSNLKCVDASWINANFEKICAGYYDEYTKENCSLGFKQRSYTKEELQKIFYSDDDLILGSEVEHET